MNYAEDRLDRKARHVDQVGGSILEKDLQQAHEYLKGPVSSSSSSSSCRVELQLKGHELAGRTLRDAGLSPQATFHYGMAWILSYYYSEQEDSKDFKNNSGNVSSEYVDTSLLSVRAKAAGDYAQMLELAGFPEMAVLCLLYYKCGGMLTMTHECSGELCSRPDEMKGNILQEVKHHGERYKMNCGCGLAQCGTSQCFVPWEMTQSTLWKDILQAFQSLENRLIVGDPAVDDQDKICAASLLEMNSKKLQKKSNLPIETAPVVSPHIPPLLRFWSEDDLPYLLQLLLMKILYSSPIGMSFLALACESVRYLSVRLPLSSKWGRTMAQTHKSHWAYYVLIYKMVLGERIKAHRRAWIPYHVPVWDIAMGLDRRKCASESCSECHCPFECVSSSISDHLHSLVGALCADHNSKQKESIIPPFPNPLHLPHGLCGRKVIYAIGDSHVLSIGWQTICIPNHNACISRTIIPSPTTGLKAWHTREETAFFTKYNLDCCFQRLPKECRTIILSAGEIDCREGIGGIQLEGYSHDCDDAVKNTAMQYVTSVQNLASKYNLQILLMPVAPHAYRNDKNGKSLGRGLRRCRMLLWNDTLRMICNEPLTEKKNVFLLDYEPKLRMKNDHSPVGFVLNQHFNADFTHMNSAFLPLLEEAIVKCGCDLSLL